LIGLVSISPLTVAVDLVVHFIPDYPAFQTMRAASPAAKAAWIALGPLGIVTTILLLRRPLWGFVLSIPFAAGVYVAGLYLWQQLVGGFWVAATACALAGIGAWLAARSSHHS